MDNRAHANQLALAHGCVLPATTGTYIGLDCFAVALTDALVNAGFARAMAAQFVLEGNQKWLDGLARLEWPDMHPLPIPIVWGPTKRALDEGMTPFPPDSNIYFAIAKKPDGDFEIACGTLLEIVGTLAEMMRASHPHQPR